MPKPIGLQLTIEQQQALKALDDVMRGMTGIGRAARALTNEGADVEAIFKRIGQVYPEFEALARAEMAAGKPLEEIRQKLLEMSQAAKSAARDTKAAMTEQATATQRAQKAAHDAADAFNRLKLSFAGIGMAAAAVIRPTAEFDAQMRNVNSILGRSESEYAAMSESIRTLGSDMGLAVPPAEKAAAMYDIVSSGFTDTAKAQEVLTAALIAGKAGLTDTKTAAETLSGVINAYGAESMTAQRASDVLFTVIKDGVTTFPELAGSLGQVTSLAASAGISFEELGAVIAAMTAKGMKTDEAITAIKGTISSVVKPSKEAQEAFKKYGIDVDAASLKSEGLIATLQKMNTAAGGNVDKMAEMSGEIRALVGTLALMNDGGVIVTRMYGDMKNSAGSALAAFNEQMKSLKATFAALTGELATAAVAAGNTFLPALTMVIGGVKTLLQGFNSLSPTLAGTIGAFALLGGGGLALAKTFSTIKDASALLSGSLLALKTAQEGATTAQTAGAAAAGGMSSRMAGLGATLGPVSLALGVVAIAAGAYIASIDAQTAKIEQQIDREEKLNKELRERRALQIAIAGGGTGPKADVAALQNAQYAKKKELLVQLDELNHKLQAGENVTLSLNESAALKDQIANLEKLIDAEDKRIKQSTEAAAKATEDQPKRDAEKEAATAATAAWEKFEADKKDGIYRSQQAELQALDAVLAKFERNRIQMLEAGRGAPTDDDYLAAEAAAYKQREQLARELGEAQAEAENDAAMAAQEAEAEKVRASEESAAKRSAIAGDLKAQIAFLEGDTTAMKVHEIDKQAAAYKEQGLDEVLVARWVAASKGKVYEDDTQTKAREAEKQRKDAEKKAKDELDAQKMLSDLEQKELDDRIETARAAGQDYTELIRKKFEIERREIEATRAAERERYGDQGDRIVDARLRENERELKKAIEETGKAGEEASKRRKEALDKERESQEKLLDQQKEARRFAGGGQGVPDAFKNGIFGFSLDPAAAAAGTSGPAAAAAGAAATTATATGTTGTGTPPFVPEGSRIAVDANGNRILVDATKAVRLHLRRASGGLAANGTRAQGAEQPTFTPSAPSASPAAAAGGGGTGAPSTITAGSLTIIANGPVTVQGGQGGGGATASGGASGAPAGPAPKRPRMALDGMAQGMAINTLGDTMALRDLHYS